MSIALRRIRMALRSHRITAALAVALWSSVPGSLHAQPAGLESPLPLPSHDYYIVTGIDPRMCPAPFCGGVLVKLVNRTATRCADGTLQPQCHAPLLDWSALGLDPEQEAQLEEAFRAGDVLARGELELADSPFGKLPELVVSDAWRGATGNEALGRFFGLLPSGIVCITHPCPELTAIWLNRTRRFAAHALDLASSGASDAQIAAGLESLHRGPGLLVAGTRRWIRGPAGQGVEIVAREFYTRVEGAKDRACGGAPNLPCVEGELCDPAAGTCDSSGVFGSCRPVGDACPLVIDPVCGCDGVTYGNDCERLLARVGLGYAGACEPPTIPSTSGTSRKR